MRHPMETAPKDGKPVVLEDDVAGTYELAEWSERECAWVGRNGKPTDLSARYWHAVQCSDSASIGSESNGLLQAGEMFRRSLDRAEAPPLVPPPVPAVLPPDLTQKSASAAVPIIDNGGSTLNTQAQQSWRRFAICCGLGMIAASLGGMFFRSDVINYFELKAVALTTRQAEANAVSLATSVSGEELTKGSNSPSAAEALENQLANLRQALSINSAEYRQALAEAVEREAQTKQIAELEATELRESLQQAREKIVSLEKELTLSKQHMSQAAVTGRQDRRSSQRQSKQRKPDGFFGEDRYSR